MNKLKVLRAGVCSLTLGLMTNTYAQERLGETYDPQIEFEKRLLPKEAIIRPSTWRHYPSPPFESHLSYAMGFGYGTPGNVLTDKAKSFELEARYHFDGWLKRLDTGVFFRSATTGSMETLEYDTGFNEERVYKVKVSTIGLSARIRTFEGLHFFGSTGLSFAKSTLTDIDTTAPVDPSLEVGFSKSLPLGIAAIGGVAYEHRWARYSVGIQAGYNVSAVNHNESLAETYGGIYFRFYHHRWNYPTFLFN